MRNAAGSAQTRTQTTQTPSRTTGTGTIMKGRQQAGTATTTATDTTTRTARTTRTATTARPTATTAAAGAAAESAGGRSTGGWAGAFVRFVVCGGGVSLLSSAVLLAVTGKVPFALANAVVTVVSTLLATELHHRITFAARGTGAAAAGWAGWRIHAKSALTLVVAYLFTTAAVLALGAVHPHASPLLTQAVYLTASGLAGTGRFLVLRLVVFARRPQRPAARTLHRGTVTVAA